MTSRLLATLSTAGFLALAACGDDEPASEEPAATATATAEPAETSTPEPTAEAKRKGTKIVLADSQFGSMLFNAKKQAIYIFEKDPQNETVCVDE